MGWREDWLAEEVAYGVIKSILYRGEGIFVEFDKLLAEICIVDAEAARRSADKATARVICERAQELGEDIAVATRALCEARGLALPDAAALTSAVWNSED